MVWMVVAVIAFCIAFYVKYGNSGWNNSVGQIATSSPTATTTAAPQQTKAPIVTKTAVPTKSGTAKTVPAKVSGYQSLAYLASLKEPLVCSIQSNEPNRLGTAYVADGRLRADVRTYSGGAITSMISDGSSLYVWKSGATKGLQLPSALSVAGSAVATQGGLDPATDVSFSCNTWTIDPSVFSPPTAVSFSHTL